MLRRLFWVALGLGLGLGLSFWVSRVVRQTAARYAPERLGSDLAEAISELRRDVAAALREGREDMRARESELRARLGPPSPP